MRRAHVVVARAVRRGMAGRERRRACSRRSPGYGWAIAAPVQAGTRRVHFTDQWVRTVELVPARAPVGRRPVGHAEAGVRVRKLAAASSRSSSRWRCSRGAAYADRDRHAPDVRTGDRGPCDLGRMVLPARRRTGGLGGPAAGREPGRAERDDPGPDPRRRASPASRRRSRCRPAAFVRIPVACARAASASSMVEWFDQWVAVGWIAHAGGGRGRRRRRAVRARRPGGRWFLPDGTTDVEEDHDYVVVMNPFAARGRLLDHPAVRAQGAGATRLAHRRRARAPSAAPAFGLNDVVLGEPTVSALVDVSVGRVAAATLGVSDTRRDPLCARVPRDAAAERSRSPAAPTPAAPSSS